MEGGDSEFANFTLPTLKAFLEARGKPAWAMTSKPTLWAAPCPTKKATTILVPPHSTDQVAGEGGWGGNGFSYTYTLGKRSA